MIDLSAAFRAVVEALDDSNVPYVVVGSTAAASWGVLRTTRDVDVVTVVDTAGARVVARLAAADELYLPVDDATAAISHGGTFNVLHPRSGGKVDVFVHRFDDAFTQSRLERRVRAEVLGVGAWIASPEDVILAKLRWRLDSRSEVQWRDCTEIAATQQLDHDYLHSWAPQLGVVADLAELLDQL